MNLNKEIIVSFEKSKYDSSIDFLKGVCILLVILTHCIPGSTRNYILFPIWGNPAVPLFLLIQVFHTYKKGLDSVGGANFGKLWRRIGRPFFIVELLIACILFLSIVTKREFSVVELQNCLVNYIQNAGKGPGSYYPWIYLQFALILPLFVPVFKRYSSKQIGIVLAVTSMLFEVVCNVINISSYLYRLLFVRYLFIIYLGFILAQNGFLLNRKTLLLSFISLLATFFFSYTNFDLEPFFYTERWKQCHWICYIYEAYLMLYLIKVAYRKVGYSTKTFLCDMGKYSYEIFLFQMVYFVCYGYLRNLLSNCINNEHIELFISVMISVIVCVYPIVYFKRSRRSRRINKY